MARLGPPGTSAFPPLVGAKRTLIGEYDRSRLRALARHDRPCRDPALVLGSNLEFLDGEPDGRVSVGRLDFADESGSMCGCVCAFAPAADGKKSRSSPEKIQLAFKTCRHVSRKVAARNAGST